LDVLTPPAVENPGMEVHIHPFQLYSVKQKYKKELYLHTSPEFCMKALLADKSEALENIFTISYCFRDEPASPIHRPQFLMLEWYRKNERYEKIMEDVTGLISYCLKQGEKKGLPVKTKFKKAQMVKKTMRELFLETINVDILDFLEVDTIKTLLHTFPDVPVPKTELSWDDYFFLLFLNKVEPLLKNYPLLLIYEFPAPLRALSTIKHGDARVCERFEVYIEGVELCNCFNELTVSGELKKRFSEQNDEKQKLYHYQLPEPQNFYRVMDAGYPASAGIALGVERLLISLFELNNPFFD